MKCLIVQPMHEAGLSLLKDNGVEPVSCPAPDMDIVARLVGGCDAAITRDAGFSSAAMRAGDRLRVVVVHGTGHDAVDKAAATTRGILVCNTPGANARSVSEMALGLALAAARRIPAADRSEREGLPGFRERERFHELSGKTALIVGWGATGRGLGVMLKAALGMRVLVHSPRVADLDGFERCASLEEGLSQADLVSLHTPLRPETHHLIDARALAAVKHGSILVNTARAGLVDEAALAEALNEGRVSAAGLDVYSHGAPAGPLGRCAGVIFTPHLGGTTGEALERVALGAARNVLDALSGRRPATTLNLGAQVRA
ncbi:MULTISPECIES: NAD(P)-dependent oxidoreductase [unclassified Aureimonas]|uniref:NAD(P)-dependent oxidoreductase n=1 Tax=unclassified Aureimonas TaxID=2615206 RepID=UPI0006FB6560|nr:MULTISPECIES: NAD(P)-dependent oxidoreductase [unclassified Aureimonas]KQT64374.1 3-phosphoglycerate dehydrogenase [Aureimonas sp. Leaf427]KQT81565.1 3-phosphoglycerate dehydrogenase [Aureimonas sp. Leaf460]